jgi:hypothetical protein
MALIRSIILELLGVVLCGQFFGHNRLLNNPLSQVNDDNALRNVTTTQPPPIQQQPPQFTPIKYSGLKW